MTDACPRCGQSPRPWSTCHVCGYRRLPLDTRWTLRDRYAYDTLLRAGYFGAAADIVQKHLTPEQVAAGRARAAELMRLFGGLS